jgi:hypothetical protein
LSKP